MKTRILSRTTRYVLWAVFTLALGHVLYQYIEATATEIEIKTGTFVEALTPGYEINYVPYTQTSPATRLYQSMFFDACMDYLFKDGQITYVEDLCSVTTNDNKNFTVMLNQDAFRSNGSPVTLDDIYATYQYILIENMRNAWSFEAYNNVAIERRADDLVVTFPEASIDNRIFFTYFILPEYITAVSYDEYVALATTQDIGSACASMTPGTIDEASMVIDVSTCEETRFDNYQLKYISDADTDTNFSYIDIIKWSSAPSDEFMTYQIPERQFAFLFFNVESPKLSPKIQRALGWFIDYTFQDEIYDEFLIDNQLVFTQFLSTGENVVNYIIAKNPNLPLDKYDLEKLNIESLPAEITINQWDTPVYSLGDIDWFKTMRVFVDDVYDRVTIAHNGGVAYAPRTYNAITQSFYYTLAPYNANLVEWLNEYEIIGVKWWEETIIANMDIYYLTSPLEDDEQVADEDKISIVYVYHPTIDYVVSRLTDIFSGADMGDYFLFEWYDDPDSFEGRLLSQDYDIVLRIVDLWQRNDWRSLFAGKNPILNPSLYSEWSFVTALGQYAENPSNQDINNNILTLYGKDMPFVILWQLFDMVSVRNTIDEQVDNDSAYTYIYNLHKELYHTISLGTRLSISWDNILNTNYISEFLRTGIINIWSGALGDNDPVDINELSE